MPAPDLIFQLANSVAALAWLALCLSPQAARHTPTVRKLAGRVLPAIFAAIYIALLLGSWPKGGGFASIEQVRILFQVPAVLVAGWLHYLAFDLFVGVWIAERAGQLKLAHWKLIPLLLLTFAFGPAGLLAFFVLTAANRNAHANA